MNEPEEALRVFLTKALVSRKERYLGFVSKVNTRVKFLDTISHELEDSLNPSRKIEVFPAGVLKMPGYKFESPDNFGEYVATFEEVISSVDDSFLLISIDGKYGIHGPETYIDSRAFYRV